MTLMYDNYLQTLSNKFEAMLQDVCAEYNFDLGDEFEIVLCKFLRMLLPQRFGICRGFAVSRDGDKKGDDILIFDRSRFPTLRLLPEDQFAQKEQIPIEAVCAYLEAKHTLTIRGEGPSSLRRAFLQVQGIKGMLREGVPVFGDPYIAGPFPIAVKTGEWPEVRNPIFGGVVARQARISEGDRICSDHEEIKQQIAAAIENPNDIDLIVAGPHNFLLPALVVDNKVSYSSPFHVPSKNSVFLYDAPGLAFAIGVCSLLLALDWIRLGRMPWGEMITEAVNDAARGTA